MDTRQLTEIALSTAGRLQATVGDAGITNVKESDLRSALRDSAYPHATDVAIEAPLKLPYWPRLGAVDVMMASGVDVVLAECKWCIKKGKLAETLWDVLKLASATSSGQAQGGLVVAAAPDATWANDPASALFEAQCWNLGDLLARFAKEWSWLFSVNKVARPQRLPAVIETVAPMNVAIQCSAASWSLRMISVTSPPGMDLRLDERGAALHEYIEDLPSEVEERMLAHDRAAQHDALVRIWQEMHPEMSPAKRIFHDKTKPHEQREQELVALKRAAVEGSQEWLDADSYLRSFSMLRGMRDSRNEPSEPEW